MQTENEGPYGREGEPWASETVTAHTPGPWEACGATIYSRDGTREIVDGQNTAVAVCYSEFFREVQGVSVSQPRVQPESEAETYANARLIAAAPALLAACRRVLRAVEWCTTDDRLTWEEQASILREAIRSVVTGGAQ